MSVAALAAAVLYLVTIPLVWWRDDYCQSLPPSPDNPAWCYSHVKKWGRPTMVAHRFRDK
jgi:hypothetical protein